MRIVIQCANTKAPGAGSLRTSTGKPVSFVAQPLGAPLDGYVVFARPDDPADVGGGSWRDLLTTYNATPSNPLKLAPAGRLYANHAYSDLVARFGLPQVYILSAGWGLIRGDFLTPRYDITFSGAADGYKRRTKADQYADYCQLTDGAEPVAFFGGKDYLPLFCKLTSAIRAERTVFYASGVPPQAPGCRLVKYDTTTRTNWHYACVKGFLAGGVK